MAYKQEASLFGFPSALLQNAGFGRLKANLRRTLLLAFTNPPCTNIGLVVVGIRVTSYHCCNDFLVVLNAPSVLSFNPYLDRNKYDKVPELL